MNRHPLVARFSFAVAILLLLAAPAWRHAAAQTTTGSLRGIVRDAGGAPLGDVTVTARDTATGWERSTSTRENGFYNLPALQPARYAITVRRLGYAPTSRALQVGVGQALTLDFTLSTTSTTLTAVTVTAETEVADTRTSEVATNVTRAQIENLPSADRNFLDLAALAPGVTLQGTRANDTRRTFRAGAQAAEQINVFVDGASYKNDILKGGVAGQDASRGNPFPRNAVQEFRVITQNYRAEYQKAASAIITATTKSGTNTFSGNIFANYINQGLVAPDVFQRMDLLSNPGFKKPDYKRTMLGLSVGGPIIRDRMHFFGSFESNAQDRTNRVSITPPSGFPALDTIDFASRNGEFGSPFRSTLLFGKVSFEHTQRSHLDVSLNTRSEKDIRDFGGLSSYETATNFKNSVTTAIAKHRFDLGSWLNEAMISYQDYHYNPTPQNPSVAKRLYGGFPNCCPTIGGHNSEQDFKQGRLSLRDDITWSGLQTAGQHIVKTGFNVDFVSYDIIKRNSEVPLFVYEPWHEGYEIPERVEFQTGDPNFSSDNRQVGLYIQDDWTPMPQLTLNLGVRWDHESGMINTDWVTPSNIRDSLTKYASRLNGYPLDPDRYFTDGNDRKPYKGAIQPRLGFSYSIDRAARTTLFGGWGVFVDRTVYDQALEERFAVQHPAYLIRFRQPGDLTPGRIDWDPSYLTEGKPALDALVSSVQANTPEVKLLPNDLRPPTSQQMSVGVRQIMGRWIGDVTYSHVRSRNVFTFYWANMNFTCPERAWSVPGCFVENRIPGFGSILLADNAGKTWYNAVQLKLDRPFRRTAQDVNWGVGTSYTYAKRETEGFNDDFSFVNPADYPRQLRNDERGRFVGNWILESRRAWGLQFSGLLTIGSGERQDVGDRFGGPGNPLRPAGFAPPTHTNLDLRLRKDFAIGRQSLGVTADLFNALNNQNLGCLTPGSDGILRAGCVQTDPQRLQVGMEVNF